MNLENQKNGTHKKTVYFLSALTLVSCVDNEQKIKEAKLLMDVGMSTYRLELYRTMQKDTTIYLDKLDSIYNIERDKTIKMVFKK